MDVDYFAKELELNDEEVAMCRTGIMKTKSGTEYLVTPVTLENMYLIRNFLYAKHKESKAQGLPEKSFTLAKMLREINEVREAQDLSKISIKSLRYACHILSEKKNRFLELKVGKSFPKDKNKGKIRLFYQIKWLGVKKK
jgi:hypothetical protein